FTLVTALSLKWWHLVGCRFLVAMGVGGEWAVASAMVAEVFAKRARAWSLAIFHASSVLGTLMAAAAGLVIDRDTYLRLPIPLRGTVGGPRGWRLSFLLGGVPALLIIWIRLSLREPESWQQTRTVSPQGMVALPRGFAALFTRQLFLRTLIGLGLAAIGLATFW